MPKGISQILSLIISESQLKWLLYKNNKNIHQTQATSVIFQSTMAKPYVFPVTSTKISFESGKNRGKMSGVDSRTFTVGKVHEKGQEWTEQGQHIMKNTREERQVLGGKRINWRMRESKPNEIAGQNRKPVTINWLYVQKINTKIWK